MKYNLMINALINLKPLFMETSNSYIDEETANNGSCGHHRLIKTASHSDLRQVMKTGETVLMTSNSGKEAFEVNGAKLRLAFSLSIYLIKSFNFSFEQFEDVVKATDKFKFGNSQFARIKLKEALRTEFFINFLQIITSLAAEESGTRMALVLLIFKHFENKEV